MKCPNCGRELKTGQLYCENCGQEIQIVPDYDPLDELLIGREDPYKRDMGRSLEDPGKDMSEKNGKNRKPSENTDNLEKQKKETERQQPERKKKSFPAKWCLLLTGLAVCFTVFIFSYRMTTRGNSYSWQLRHGKALVEKEEYEEAIPYLKKAQELQADTEGADTEALRYLAKAYACTDADELAASCMETALKVEETARGDEGELLELYLEYMDILNLTGQTELIEDVIEACSYPDIQKQLLPYRVEKPSCDVQEGTYSYYLRLELEADYGSIYYTLDGTEPTKESTRYENPIELREEGETLLSAVAINSKGMVSDQLVLVYKLNFQDDSY